MTDRRKFRCLNVIKAVHFRVSNRVPFTRQLHDASHVEVEAVELVVCVKIR